MAPGEESALSYEVESHDDGSVTIKVGSLTAHIQGDGYREVALTAHVLGRTIARAHEAAVMRTSLSLLRQRIVELEQALAAAERAMGDVEVLAIEAASVRR